MNEPTPQNNPNLDPETRRDLRLIALETSLEKLSKYADNIMADYAGTRRFTTELAIRITTLERALNATFATKEPTKSVEKLDKPNPISFLQSPHWNFWK